MDPALVSASFVGLSGLVGVLIGFVFVYKGFNRKHILLFSAIGTALAFFGLGIRGVIQSDPNGTYNFRAQLDWAYEFPDRTGPETQICRTYPTGPD